MSHALNSSANIVLEISGDSLRSLESLLDSAEVQKLRPCLIEQMVGATPTESQRKKLIFNILDTALVNCGKSRISSDSERQIWDALNRVFTSVEGEETQNGLKFKLTVDKDLLKVFRTLTDNRYREINF